MANQTSLLIRRQNSQKGNMPQQILQIIWENYMSKSKADKFSEVTRTTTK
jgi:hypothetical protein